jgi:hypothetical protein
VEPDRPGTGSGRFQTDGIQNVESEFEKKILQKSLKILQVAMDAMV